MMRGMEHTTALHNQPWYRGERDRRMSKVDADLQVEQGRVDLHEKLMAFISLRRNGGLNLGRLADDFAAEHPGHEMDFSAPRQKWSIGRSYRDRVWGELHNMVKMGFLSLKGDEIGLIEDTPADVERTGRVRKVVEENGYVFKGTLDKLAMTKGVGPVDGSELHLMVPVLAMMVQRGQLRHNDNVNGVELELVRPYTRSWAEIKKEQEKDFNTHDDRE